MKSSFSLLNIFLKPTASLKDFGLRSDFFLAIYSIFMKFSANLVQKTYILLYFRNFFLILHVVNDLDEESYI